MGSSSQCDGAVDDGAVDPGAVGAGAVPEGLFLIGGGPASNVDQVIGPTTPSAISLFIL